MPQPVTYNPGTPVSGSIQENSISYVVDGQNRNYRGGFGGLSWMSEVPAANNVIFIGNSVSLGRGPANIPLFYPSYNNSAANIIYAANTLPGSPRNFTTTGSAYDWAATNNFFINNSDNPIPRIDADGLAFYVDASQPTSYPQTGTSVYDLSGFNRNSTLTNGPTFNSNGWIEFDGADDRSTTSFGFLSNSESHEAWIYSKGSVSTYNMFMGIILPYYGFYTGNTFIVQDYIGGAQVGYFTGTLSLNRWYHFLSTRSYNGTNTTLTTYINGTLSNQSTYSGAPSIAGGTWAIGNWDAPSAGTSYPFYGNISGAKIYTQALTEAQVKQNYFQGNIVTGSLVFMVDANNLVSYPKSGTSWYNLTGSVASGSLINGPTFSPSNGGSIVFDGVDDYAVTSNFPSLSNWSTEMWLNPNVYTTAQRVILDVNLGIRFEISNGFFNSHFGNGSGWIYTNLPSTTQIAPNTWFHVVVTVDASVNYQAKVYVNGVLENTINISSGTTPNVPLYIARFTGAGGYEFNGKIANTRIYNKALTPDEVQQNYQATKDKFLGQNIVTNGLVLNLDSTNKDSYPGTGTTWTDLSGNGNNGTLTNGPSFLSNQNGGTISLDGVDDYVNVGCTPNTIRAYNSSTEFVIKLPLYSGGQRNILSYRSAGTMYIGKSSGGIFVYYDTLNNPAYIVGSIADGSIAHCVVICDATNNLLSVYINGTLAGSVSRTGWLTTYNNTLNLGFDSGVNEYMVGNMYLFRHYNKTLSASEVLQNYNATKTRFGL